MKKRSLVEVLQQFYEEEILYTSDFNTYSREAFSRLTHLPLEKFKDKFPIELISRMLEKYFLENPHYEEDMKMILKNIDNNEINYWLIYVATYKAYLESKYNISDEHHTYDMNILQNCQNQKVARFVMSVALDLNSLQSEFHREDIKVIASLKDVGKAEILATLACHPNSLAKESHLQDIETVISSDDYTVILDLLDKATSEENLQIETQKEPLIKR